MALFCEVFRDWGDSGILRFRYRQSMFIDSFPERTSSFTNIVFVTFSTCDKVYVHLKSHVHLIILCAQTDKQTNGTDGNTPVSTLRRQG